ncbi:glycosyltransferase [Halomonas litopenaei]|nr:glycosyltransferase [Halomonas litopenaei]
MGFFSSDYICDLNVDIVHLHWINNCTISLREISKLKKPFVVTMHDEWWYLNGYHYRNMKKNGKRDLKEVLVFPIKWLYEVYRNRYISKIIDNGRFVAPSRWVKREAEKNNSRFSGKISVIPNPIDIDVFIKRERYLSMKKFNVPEDKKILLFGAQKGGGEFIKGKDIAFSAIDELSKRHDGGEYAVLIFGGESEGRYFRNEVEIIEVGFISSAEEMSFLYSCADVTLVTSRLEAFGQVALESIACQTPVIAFRNTGVEDIIEHGKTGFLCSPFSYIDVADYLEELFKLDDDEKTKMGTRCRCAAKSKFSQESVSDRLNELYQSTVKGGE